MRFVKWVSGIFLLASAAIGLIVVIGRVLHPQAVCLLYDTRDRQGGNIIAIDPTNGNRYIYRRAPAFLPLDPGNGDLSPDGSHEIYLIGAQNGPYSLYIDPKPLKGQDGAKYCFQSITCWLGERAPNPQARLVASGMQQQFMAVWLDNDRIAYSISLKDQKQTLVVERIDGSDQYRLPATLDQGDVIAIRSWDKQRIVFVVNRGNTNDVYIWSLPERRYITCSSIRNNPYGGPTLSPQGKYVTVIDQGHVVILGAETQKRLEFVLQSQYLYSIDWAPDERHLVVHYQDNAYERRQIIYGVDGSEEPYTGGYGLWSKDGRTYLYLSATGKSNDLIILYVDDGQLETFASNIDWLYGVLDSGQILGTWKENSEVVLGTLEPGTKNRHIITDNISDIGDILILNNGHTILYMVGHGDQGMNAEIINADGSNYGLLARGIIYFANPQIINGGKSFLFFAFHDGLINLEMIDLDGSNHRTFVTGLEDIQRDITWSTGPYGSAVYDSETPDHIAFAGKRNGVLTAELVNLHTGDHQILAQGFAGIDGLGPDLQLGGVSFYWEYANHEDGFDAYTIEGKPIFHLKLPGDYSFNYDYQIFSYLPSPNKNMVAVLERYDAIKLYFMAPDSSWQKLIEADLGSVGGGSGYAQAWSPDGKQFAFSAIDPTGYSIRIVDENGDELHRFTGFTPGSSRDLLWTHCQ